MFWLQALLKSLHKDPPPDFCLKHSVLPFKSNMTWYDRLGGQGT